MYCEVPSLFTRTRSKQCRQADPDTTSMAKLHCIDSSTLTIFNPNFKLRIRFVQWIKYYRPAQAKPDPRPPFPIQQLGSKLGKPIKIREKQDTKEFKLVNLIRGISNGNGSVQLANVWWSDHKYVRIKP